MKNIDPDTAFDDEFEGLTAEKKALTLNKKVIL